MKANLFKRTKQVVRLDMAAIEERLSATLRPVELRPQFVGDLRSQLLSQFDAVRKEFPENTTQLLLVSIASLLSGIMLLVLGIRSVILLLSGLGLLHQLKRQAARKTATTIPQTS